MMVLVIIIALVGSMVTPENVYFKSQENSKWACNILQSARWLILEALMILSNGKSKHLFKCQSNGDGSSHKSSPPYDYLERIACQKPVISTNSQMLLLPSKIITFRCENADLVSECDFTCSVSMPIHVIGQSR